MPTARHLYILDFDRTLFDTHRFFEDMQSALRRTHQLNTKAFIDTFETFMEPKTGGYDPHRHHEHLLGLTADELDEVISHELDGRDYTFPDAAQWLDRHIHDQMEDLIVVTMGRPRYQALKFRHARETQSLHKIVVNTNKGALIRHHLTEGGGEYDLHFLDKPYEQMTLIDDSADTFTALGAIDKITGIRIARPGQKYTEIPTPPHIRHITSFGELS
jgi:hypothetical protein